MFESVTIGDKMKEIGIYAFSQCKAVRSFTIRTVTPPTLLSTTGESLDGLDQAACTLYVPDESIEAYSTATEWKLFGEIVGLGTSAIDGVGEDVDAAPVEFYDFQGRRVTTLSTGIYIRRQGSEVSKIKL